MHGLRHVEYRFLIGRLLIIHKIIFLRYIYTYGCFGEGFIFIASALDIQLTKIDTVKLDTSYGNWGMYKIEDDILTIQGWPKLIVPHYYRRRFKILPDKNLLFVRASGGKLGLSAISRPKIKVIKKPSLSIMLSLISGIKSSQVGHAQAVTRHVRVPGLCPVEMS